MDLDRPSIPERVLVFVRTNVPENEIVDEVHKALTVWREQTERLPDGDSTDGVSLERKEGPQQLIWDRRFGTVGSLTGRFAPLAETR